MKHNKHHLEIKTTASYLYQRFLGLDKRLRKNLIIGASMILMIVVTGVLLALIALVKFGGSLIEGSV